MANMSLLKRFITSIILLLVLVLITIAPAKTKSDSQYSTCKIKDTKTASTFPAPSQNHSRTKNIATAKSNELEISPDELKSGYKQGQVIIKCKASVNEEQINKVCDFTGVADNIQRIESSTGNNIYLLKLKPDVSVEDAIKELRSQSDILYVEPDYLREACFIPSDPYFSHQWGLNNTGQTIVGVRGTNDADIDAPEGWDIERGYSNPVTVAIIDTGIDFDHPDLYGKFWKNTDETPDNGIDDDSNGYIDDVAGYNWAGISQQHSNANLSFGYTNTDKVAQSIKGTGQPLSHVGFFLAKQGSPSADIIISVRNNLNGSDLQTITIHPSDIGSNSTYIYRTFGSPITLTYDSTYYIVLRTTSTSSTNFYKVLNNDSAISNHYSDPFKDGLEYRHIGGSWYNYPDNDLYFITNTNANPRDDNGHGTHISGIIGAAGNNSLGITGISYGAKIMPLKLLNASGICTTSNLVSAIYYAVDNDARVINMSLGGAYYSTAEQDAVNYAYANGTILCAAVGNIGSTAIVYPAGYANVIGVGATDNKDQWCSYSNYNNTVDISAPGWAVYSTMPTYPVSLNSLGCYQNYDYLQGTSTASAYTSGLVSLTLSKNPNLTPLQVEELIEQSALDLGDTGRDNKYGYGRINLYNSIANAENPPISAESAYVASLYKNILNRDPDPIGLAGWINTLRTGTWSRSQIALAFASCYEYHARIATGLYTYVLNRAPDPIGLDGWAKAMTPPNNLPDEKVKAYFYGSDEYFWYHTGSDNEEYVRSLYMDSAIIDREGDPEIEDPIGFWGWVNALNAGTITRSQVALSFINSYEYHRTFITELYNRVLQRTPTESEVHNWAVALTNGLPDGDVEGAFFGSDEYYIKLQ